ncbi:ABC transporter [Brevundimonas sp. Leaf280]|uniref:ABC transporter transmembrane domain-containing protein n=1 Tax=Brevundimonas nasdae TaxID=172043 RepID=A0ACD4VH58_9CAUL|nr:MULTISPECIES: ABC transporter transmembrane domain-containing protein [Brevundimonas]KQP44088.1 ABC transporter [Brevundimonas sp. Leaf280]KQR61362.1 ABC transporter [Brevundimonas sp. Leaf168]MRL69118.1 ATP-binding cassette domain-containing protein [Brevundimonas sp. SPF441]NSX32641.1 ATP-binding cassette domain-containing protein [Brevundimonas vesicularis]QIF81316.1 ATP-binding cassette domain-containing protein [Brevundimonas sp. 'scallop']
MTDQAAASAPSANRASGMASLEGRPSAGALLADQMSEAGAKRAKRRDIRPLARLIPFAMRHKGHALMAVFWLLLSTAASLGLTALARGAIDHGFEAGGANLNIWFLLLGANALFLGLATAARYYFVTRTGERVIADVRKGLFGRILTLDPSFYAHMRTGEVLSRLTTDIALVETLMTTSISYALRNFLTLIGGVALLFFVSPKLTGFVLLIVPFLLGPIFIFGRKVRKLTVASQDRFANAVGFAGESVDAIETVQAFGREQSAITRFGAAVEDAFNASLTRMQARAWMTALIIVVMFGGVTLVLWLGAQDVVKGAMTPGALLQFVLLSVFAAGAVGALGESWGDVQKAAGAMERIEELMRAVAGIAPPPQATALPTPPRGEVSMSAVGFAYPGRPDLPALKGFSLTVRPGETVALVGPSGAGKSTVFRLLLRFYDPQTGMVSVDGVDVRQADPVAVRDRFAWVSQETPLFSGSALENIRFGRENTTLEEARAVAEKAQALGFIDALPEGFDTPLGERGKSLSGGQRQRLAIARALVRDAPILLLDEATSALDAESERLVQVALDQAMEERTTLVIAHRLATVLRADRIVVMDDGRVVEEGTHEQLVAQGGLYARLAELQFRN